MNHFLSELIADAKAEWGKVAPLLEGFLAANPGIEASAVTEAKAVVATVTDKLETAATHAADAEATKVAPAIALELIPTLNGLIEQGIAAAQAAADAEIAKLTALKSAVQS